MGMELAGSVNKAYMKRNNRWSRLRKRGLSLVEGAAVLAIAGVVFASALLLYNMANQSRLVSQATQDLTVVQQAIRSLYVSQPSYDGVGSSVLVSTKALPARMITSAGVLRHSLNGNINVSEATSGSSFIIEFTNVPQEACVKMLLNDLGRSLLSAGASVKRTQDQGLPFSPAQAAATCDQTASNTITWEFN